MMFAALAVLAVALVSIALAAYSFRRMQRAEFWEPQIRAYEESDRHQAPAPGGIVFTGSSSIRFWDTLARDLAPLPVVNRGFGGAHLDHVTRYADRIIVPCRPRAIVLYAGENDLGWPNPTTPADLLASFERFVTAVRKELAGVHIYFLSVKLSRSLLRRCRWERMREANRLIGNYIAGRDRLTFIDVCTPMLDAHGRPRRELFRWDGLHLSPAGYALWTAAIKPVLVHDWPAMK
jgi:lysophospholipase L1-like esterase